MHDTLEYGFKYILAADSSPGGTSKWQEMSLRVVYVCAMWHHKCVVQEQLNMNLLDHLKNSDGGRALVTTFQIEYCLTPVLLPKVFTCADDFAKLHTSHGRTFYGMSFAAREGTATSLMQRTPGSSPKGEITGTDHLQACLPKKLKDVLDSKPPPDVIALSGESGGGKTFTTLNAAVQTGVAFYLTCRDEGFHALEARLAKAPLEASHPQLVFDFLLDTFKNNGWNVSKATKRTVCLVLDEIGPFPKCARAVCKLQSGIVNKSPTKNEEPQRTADGGVSHLADAGGPVPPELNEFTIAAECNNAGPTINELLLGFKEHFKTDRVVVFVVGTGVEGAFTDVANDSMPESCRHLRVDEFTDLRLVYEGSRFWRTVADNVSEAERSCGIFARLRRLAQNPRMAALLVSLDNKASQSFDNARSLGAMSSFLRGRAINMVSNAIIQIKSFNALHSVDQMTATTWFGAAFALACSTDKQDDKNKDKPDEVHPCITALCTTYGLMSDRLIKGQKQELEHRFLVTAAAVELGFSGFGMTPPHSGWSGFEHVMADLCFLHAFSAACAGECGIALPDTLKSNNVAEDSSDPLVCIKDYLRTHGYKARKVTRVQLKQQVKTYCAAAEALEKEAELACGPKAHKERCVVVALNGDKAPFADIVVGLVTVENEKFKTTHLMLVQLKLYTRTKLTALQEWEEMRKMGSREREAVIAGCVTQFNQSFEDAMKPLQFAKNSAKNHRKIVDGAKANFDEATKKGTNENVQFVPTAATKNELFAALCNDARVTVRTLTPYEEALECYTRVGQLNFAATLANFLDVRQAEKRTPQNELILQPANKLPDGSTKYLPQEEESLEKESTELLAKLNKILEAKTKKAVKFDRIIEAHLVVAKKYSIEIDPGRSPPEVKRFIVTYYAPTPGDEVLDDKELEVKERHQEAASTVKKPENSLTITKTNRSAAFYPTSWETDGFTTSTMTREVMSLKFICSK